MSGNVRLKPNGYLDEDGMSLLDIAFNRICQDLRLISTQNTEADNYVLNDDIILPSNICNSLLEAYQRNNRQLDDKVANIFSDTMRTSLKYVHLRNSIVTHQGLEILMRHKLHSLRIWYCDNINVNSHHLLETYGGNLHTLELGISSNLVQHAEPNEKEPVHFRLPCPHLRRLVMHGVVLHGSGLFTDLKSLVHLDLTSCHIHEEYSFQEISQLTNLQTLILFNVWPIYANMLDCICDLRRLRFLDISVSSTGNGHGKYKFPDEKLEMLIRNLKELTHLDISGTNLAGTGVMYSYYKGTDIQGLASRIEKPLQFLGLYHTAHGACKRHDIPAIEVAGDVNEKQILTAARYYHDRPVLLTRVLNDLYHLFRFENCKEIHTALDVVLTAMDRHLKFKHMQISGSATLFYIVKFSDRSKFGTTLRNHIIRTILNGMEVHRNDDTMLRNGYLTLTQFQMPHHVLFEYKRLIKVLLFGVSRTEHEGFVQRIAIYLLNTLACQVDGKQKLWLGKLGVVSTMLTLIKDRLTRSMFDDVMEVAWSTMWNVTDETAINCKRFLDGRGMEYFLKCLNIFPDRAELLRNMMGLLGNVAEVKSLRHKLMTQEFIEVFYKLLESESDGIEVSYNAAGVLSHIASDGPEAWHIMTPTREDVLIRMVKAISRWNIKSERNINYRSFEPILGLVRCYETPQCQHWAVWALANLTQVYPDKYCQLVEQENGIEILTALIEHPNPYDEIKELARMVIEQCKNMPTPMMLEG